MAVPDIYGLIVVPNGYSGKCSLYIKSNGAIEKIAGPDIIEYVDNTHVRFLSNSYGFPSIFA